MRVSGGAGSVHSRMYRIFERATATPLLVLCRIKSRGTTRNAFTVLTADKVIITCFTFFSPLAVKAKMVPVAEVTPGTIDVKTPANVPVIIDRIDAFFSSGLRKGSSVF